MRLNIHLIFFKSFFEVNEQNTVRVDGPEDDSVAKETWKHYQPCLKQRNNALKWFEIKIECCFVVIISEINIKYLFKQKIPFLWLNVVF